MIERKSARVLTTLLVAAGCAGDRAAAVHGEVRQRLVDGGTESGAPLRADGSTDAGADASLPRTPGAVYDFLTPSPPKLKLTRMSKYLPAQVLDSSVTPPEPHEYLAPADLEFFPDGSGDSLVALVTGQVLWLDRDFGVRGYFQVDSANDLAKYRARDDVFWDNEGLLGVTFDPHFAENGWFYLHVNADHLGGVDIWKLRWKPDQMTRLWESRRRVFHVDKSDVAAAPNYLVVHNGGNPSFGPDGFLYVFLGDGGIGGGLPWDTNPAQDVASPWGKVLRVDPDAKLPPEVVAYGMRNPFTHAFRGNELFVGDVSADWTQCSDEIHRVVIAKGQTRAPLNFGWPRTCGPCSAETLLWPIGCDDGMNPVHSYRKDSTAFAKQDPESTYAAAPAGSINRSAIILGPAYAGGAYRGYLDNVVLYSDLIQGWMRGALFDTHGKLVADRHLLHHEQWITAFAVGPDARIYVLGGFKTDFGVYRIDLVEP